MVGPPSLMRTSDLDTIAPLALRAIQRRVGRANDVFDDIMCGVAGSKSDTHRGTELSRDGDNRVVRHKTTGPFADHLRGFKITGNYSARL